MKYIREQLEALTLLALSEDPNEKKYLQKKLREMLDNNHRAGTIEEVLTELGVPDNQAGYRYLVRAIQIQMEHDEPVAFGAFLWPTLAKEFNASASAVEKGCRHSVETCAVRADYDTLRKYFGGAISPDKGKPTLRHLITRVANLLKEDKYV